MILEQYSNLFTNKMESEDVGSISMPSKWAFISMVDRLSNGDITKHNEIYEQNFIYCLNILGFWHDRDAYMDQINKRLEMKNKHR